MLIFLIGLPGSGKSRIGPAVAKALNMMFLDTDKEIEKEQGMKVAEIFKQEGEPAFREMETHMLQDCLQETHAVIATGGGLACHSGNMDTMLKAGLVIRLFPPLEEIADHILEENPAKRPLMADCDTKPKVMARLKELLAEREQHYSRAHITVRSPDFVTDFITELSPHT